MMKNLFIGIVLCCTGILLPVMQQPLPHNKGSGIFFTPTFTLQDPSIQTVYEACLYYGVICPEIVVAQSLLETGFYTSKVCKDYNNILGLYNSYTKDYYKFNHWSESIQGYINLVQYKLGKQKYSAEEYYQFLIDLPYATDPNYITKVQFLVEKYVTFSVN